jgi:hypothetical protein
MLYVINEKTMGTKNIFVEVTLWKLLDKTRMWIPLSNKRKNSWEFGKGSRNKRGRRRRNLCLCKLPFMLKRNKPMVR